MNNTCYGCKYHEKFGSRLVGCSKKRKIILDADKAHDCYEQDNVAAFKDMFDQIFKGAYSV